MELPAGARIDGEGVWCQVLDRAPAPTSGRAALFLDRDGVVVVEVGYLHRPEEMRLEEGAAATIAAANAKGVAVVVVTNQAGIAYGRYGWAEFAAVQAAMLESLGDAGARIDAVYACPHHARGRPPFDHPDHPARKPNPGMLLRAADALGLDLGASWIIGDRASDIDAGRRAGLAGGVQVLTGHGARPGECEKAAALAGPGFAVHAGATSIGAAARLVPLMA